MCEHRSFYNPNRGDPKGLRLQVVWESHTKIFKNPKKAIRKGCMYGISTYTLTIKKSAIHVGKDINPMGILWNASQKREI